MQNIFVATPFSNCRIYQPSNVHVWISGILLSNIGGGGREKDLLEHHRIANTIGDFCYQIQLMAGTRENTSSFLLQCSLLPGGILLLQGSMSVFACHYG
jgi:hypothetical protein